MHPAAQDTTRSRRLSHCSLCSGWSTADFQVIRLIALPIHLAHAQA
jgi:hypothetical protein